MALVNFGDASDGGYPSSIQLEDETIVTAYYASSTPCHNRYHMGVIFWNWQEQYEKNVKNFGLNPHVLFFLGKDRFFQSSVS